MTGLMKVGSAAEEEEARRSIREGARLGDGERSAAEEEEVRRSISRLGEGGGPVRLGSRCRLGWGERQSTGVLGCLVIANRVGDRSGTLRRGLPCREEPFRSESALHDREFPRKGLPCLGNTSLCRGLS